MTLLFIYPLLIITMLEVFYFILILVLVPFIINIRYVFNQGPFII